MPQMACEYYRAPLLQSKRRTFRQRRRRTVVAALRGSPKFRAGIGSFRDLRVSDFRYQRRIYGPAKTPPIPSNRIAYAPKSFASNKRIGKIVVSIFSLEILVGVGGSWCLVRIAFNLLPTLRWR